MKSSLASPPPAPQALSADFDHARRCLAAAKGYVMQGAGFMLLAGVELKRLKKLHGVQRGGDRKSDQTRSGSGLISWADVVRRELGITDDTAAKYILMAECSKERVAVLKDLEEKLLTAPLHALPEAQQAKVTKAVAKLCDGKTGKEVMQELGIARADAKPISEGNRNKGGNSTAKKTTPEEEAQEHFRPALVTLMNLRLDAPEKWRHLLYHLPLQPADGETVHDRMDIISAVDELEVWLGEFRTAQQRLAKALHASRKQDAREREKEAVALALKAEGGRRKAEGKEAGDE